MRPRLSHRIRIELATDSLGHARVKALLAACRRDQYDIRRDPERGEEFSAIEIAELPEDAEDALRALESGAHGLSVQRVTRNAW